MIIHKSIKKNSHSLILLTILVLLLVAGILLIPKVSARLLPYNRSNEITTFVQQVRQTKQVNPQAFWELREFYSPGYFRVEKNGIEISHDQLSFVKRSTPLPFSFFTAPLTKSYDFLVPQSSLSAYISHPYTKILVQTPTLLISQGTDNTLIAFILPTSELLKANGFFKFSEDKKLLEGKYWLDVTLLRGN